MRTAIFCLILLQQISTKLLAQVQLYAEKNRPQFHFSPPAHWMNDPNGMVYYKGEYHLFYQHYPDSTVWGPMHWGHAISKDLVHWQNLPIALYPDSIGDIFSGSVVVDNDNTAGFQKGDEKALVAIFTYHNMAMEKAGKNNFQTQGIAYSNDKGRTWIKYSKNPVIKNSGIKDFRDPKVSWHQQSKNWVLTLAAGNEIHFYTSRNLKDWALSGKFGSDEGSHGGVWECPDLIEMRVNNELEKKWVLLVSIGNGAINGGSGTQYFIGSFDGNTFKNNNPKETILWLDYGTDNYAGVTWSNVDKHLFLGWMSNWQYAQTVPTSTWRSAMTIPRELSLQKTKKGIRVFSNPVKEIQSLRSSKTPVDIKNNVAYPFSLGELILDFDADKQSEDFGIEFFNAAKEKIKVGFKKSSNQFYIDRTNLGDSTFSKTFSAIHYAPRLSKDKKLSMHIFIDHASVELFADNGSINITDIFFPNEKLNTFQLYPSTENLLLNGEFYELKTIW
jgi:fructan beta-fructosidase